VHRCRYSARATAKPLVERRRETSRAERVHHAGGRGTWLTSNRRGGPLGGAPQGEVSRCRSRAGGSIGQPRTVRQSISNSPVVEPPEEASAVASGRMENALGGDVREIVDAPTLTRVLAVMGRQ